MSSRNITIIFVALLIGVACRSVASKTRFASMFSEAVTKVNDHALLKTSERELFDNAMDGMLQSLDEYSQYISGDMYQIMTEQLKQEFGGVGMFVGTHPVTEQLTVTATLPNTPAHRAGIRAGDLILKIDGASTTGLNSTQAARAIHGPVGKPVLLTIQRGDEQLALAVVRDSIAIQTVRGEQFQANGTWNFLLPEDRRVAYVEITDFSEKTADELRDVLTRVGPDSGALILDLRSNGGGLLTHAVEICDMFLDQRQTIVEIRGRDQQLIEAPYRSTTGALWPPHKPLVVLIDRNSASASEIVAACLQDLGRAVVIGEPSYGKGTVQNVVPLERNRSSIKITTATWWTPAGRNVDRNPKISGTESHGVQPSPGYAFDFDDVTVFQINLLRTQRQYELLDVVDFGDEILDELDSTRSNAKGGPAVENDVPAQPRLTEDPVLQRAIEYLKQQLDDAATT